MKGIIYSLPDQIRRSLTSVPAAAIRRRSLDRVVCCGMGGSGISADILAALYPEIPVVANKDYPVPKYAGRNDLAIFISYSGNTEETLNNYRQLARKAGGRVIITSGGALSNRPADLKVRVPSGLPPRGALGYLFTPLPMVLHRFGLIRSDPRPSLAALAGFLTHARDKIRRRARSWAGRFRGKLPLLYADTAAFGVVANRWRCQFNENAKILCHTGILPEMNHNELVGLGRPKRLNRDILIVFLRDPESSPRNARRIAVMKDLIRNDLRDIIEIEPEGRNRIQRMFWTVMLGDFISYYLAELTGVDPLPVKRIEYLKKKLKDR